MAKRIFNGSSVSFGGSPVGKFAGFSFKGGSQTADTTDPDDDDSLIEVGTKSREFTINVKGAGTIPDIGSIGVLSFTLTNGHSLPVTGNFQVTDAEYTGKFNDGFSGSFSVKRTSATSS